MTEATILDIRARTVIAPLQRPIRTASGAIEASPLVLLDVVTDQGVTGSAYLFAYTPLMLRPLRALIDQVAPLLRGQPVVPWARQQQLEKEAAAALKQTMATLGGSKSKNIGAKKRAA